MFFIMIAAKKPHGFHGHIVSDGLLPTLSNIIVPVQSDILDIALINKLSRCVNF